MCGITGFVNRRVEKEKILENMMARIVHRGPDESGLYIDDLVAMGHQRLSIIDVASGHQPMYNESEDILIVFNGEIYNFMELKQELPNHIFKTNSDTEVLIHAYEEWGKDFVKRLRGMFAFCIYDKRKQELFLVRDHFGIKPLYYYKSGDTFMFSSEIKSFLDHPDFKKELNHEMLGAYLTFSFTPGERTFFKNVYKVPAAHTITLNVNTLDFKIDKYFKIEFEKETTSKSYEETVEEISKVMKDSVKHHLISDVEIGSFLSSGVDSSYVVSLAKPDKTYTVGYTNKKYSEIENARDLCEKLNINSTSALITKEEYMSILKDVYYFMDEPTTDGCSVAVYCLSKLASKDVKVVLSGEGADEFFGGYNSYDEYWYAKLPLGIRKAVAGVCKVLPKSKYTKYLMRQGKSLEESYVSMNRNFYDDELDDILKIKDYLKNKDILKSTFDEYKNESRLNKKLAVDIKYWFTDNILAIADKMPMAFSLESRVPFTDVEVYKISSKLKKEYKVRNGVTKSALRDAAKMSIPNESYKNKKLAFPVPIREWIREDDFYTEIKETFNLPIADKLFNRKNIMKLLDDHKYNVADNYRKIWAVYSFLKWYQVYFMEIC